MDKHGWLLTLSLWNLAATATPPKPISQSWIQCGNELLNKALSYNLVFSLISLYNLVLPTMLQPMPLIPTLKEGSLYLFLH
jgi:hypothetical protein